MQPNSRLICVTAALVSFTALPGCSDSVGANQALPTPMNPAAPMAATTTPSTGGAQTGGAGAPGEVPVTAPPPPTPPPIPIAGAGGEPATLPDPPDVIPDAGVAEPPPAEDGPYTCTLMIGINATSEWYVEGFEDLVNDDAWQLIRVHSGFAELWADPDHDFWNTEPTSQCTENADTPDRVIFVALNFDYTELGQWLPAIEGVAQNLKDKYPNAKRFELATFVRAPGNEPCPQKEPKRSTIHPTEDEAIAMVVEQNAPLFQASPKFEVRNCDDFTDNPPHPSPEGARYIAQMVAEHYGLKD